MGQLPQYLWIHLCDTDFYMSCELQIVSSSYCWKCLSPYQRLCYSVGVLAGLRTDLFREIGAEKSNKYLGFFHMLCEWFTCSIKHIFLHIPLAVSVAVEIFVLASHISFLF